MGQPFEQLKTKPISHSSEEILITLALTEKEKEQVYHFRHNVISKEKIEQTSTAEYRNDTLSDDLDDWGLLFYAKTDSKIVGTIRLNIGFKDSFKPELMQALGLDIFDTFQSLDGPPYQIAYISQGIIDRDYRNFKIYTKLVAVLYDICRRHDIFFAFCATMPHLTAMHETLGFRHYKKNLYLSDLGYSVPLVNILHDTEFLDRIRSPLHANAIKWPSSKKSVEWFNSQFPLANDQFPHRSLFDNIGFEKYIAAKLGQPPHKAITIFKGFSDLEAQTCLKFSHLLWCEKNDTIIYPSEISEAIYIVISGLLTTFPEQSPIYNIIKPGQAFGGQSFLLRSVQKNSLRAQTTAELLVLSRVSLEKLKLIHPEIAGRLLRNIVFAIANTDSLL